MKLCQKHKIHLLADEIYAATVYDVPDKDAVPFTSVLSFDFSQYIDAEYLHVIYGTLYTMSQLQVIDANTTLRSKQRFCCWRAATWLYISTKQGTQSRYSLHSTVSLARRSEPTDCDSTTRG